MSMLHGKLLWVAVAILAVTVVPWAQVEAATVEAMTLDEMSQRAEVIVVGRVMGSRA